MTAPFTIRPGSSTLKDGERILNFLDSQLPWLAQHGAEGQWGSTPFSLNEDSLDKYRRKVERSEANLTWSQDWTKVYIVEVDKGSNVLGASERKDPDGVTPERLPVAAMILSGSSPLYTRAVIPAQDDKDPFLYVSLIVSDRSRGEISKGSGEVLLDHAKKVAKGLGLSTICLDCWNGNGRRLVE